MAIYKIIVNVIKNKPISIAIVLLALTQVPDFIAKGHFNRCVVEFKKVAMQDATETPDWAHFRAVNRCNGN